MNFSDYQAIPALNASAIVAGSVSMADMHDVMTGPRDDPTPSQLWGQQCHLFMLEPDRAANMVVVSSLNTKEAKAARAELGVEMVTTPKKHDVLKRMRDALFSDNDIGRLFAMSFHETVIEFDAKTWKGKSRLDMIHTGDEWFADYKTTGPLGNNDRRFCAQFSELRYDLRLGVYYRAARQPAVCHVVAQQTKRPYHARLYTIGEDDMRGWWEEADRIARQYVECCKVGSWPGVPNKGTIILPDWHGGRMDPDLSSLGAITTEGSEE